MEAEIICCINLKANHVGWGLDSVSQEELLHISCQCSDFTRQRYDAPEDERIPMRGAKKNLFFRTSFSSLIWPFYLVGCLFIPPKSSIAVNITSLLPVFCDRHFQHHNQPDFHYCGFPVYHKYHTTLTDPEFDCYSYYLDQYWQPQLQYPEIGIHLPEQNYDCDFLYSMIQYHYYPWITIWILILSN